MADGYRIGVDIGGTFTDVVLLGAEGTLRTKKVLSTPDDYARGVVQGILELLEETGAAPASVTKVVHATTVASNAVLEGKGSRCALLTTAGFRDVLELRRLRIPVMYELQYEKPPPLVPRRLRYEIPERIGPRGEEWIALDEDAVREAASAGARRRCRRGRDQLPARLREPGRTSVAPPRSCGRSSATDVYITCSSDILAEIREYERTSTAVVNAYVGPVVERYIRSLESSLAEAGIAAPLQIMQSSGGADERRVREPEAGAHGRIGAGRRCRRLRLPRARDGHPERDLPRHGRDDGEGRDPRGRPAGQDLGVRGRRRDQPQQPARSRAAATRSGCRSSTSRRSARAAAASSRWTRSGCCASAPKARAPIPGPACYGLRRRRADVDRRPVVLGYLNPEYLAGGTVAIDADAAADAVESVAGPLGREAFEAAARRLELAVATMTRAVKAVSTYRGRDPRDFVLCGFGGNGPVVAAAIARALQMRRVLVPLGAGVFSAAGLLLSEIEHEFVRTLTVRGRDARRRCCSRLPRLEERGRGGAGRRRRFPRGAWSSRASPTFAIPGRPTS